MQLLGILWLVIALASAAIRADSDGPPTVRAGRRAVVRALEAALILSGQEGGTIRTAVVAVPLPDPAGGDRLHLVVEIEGAPAIEGWENDLLELDVFLYLLSREGEVISSTGHHLELDLARHGELVAGAGVRLATSLETDPGDHLLRVLVRSETQAFGMRSVRVSSPEAGEAVLLGPLVGQAEQGWLSADPGPDLAPPWSLDDPFLPTGLPVLAAGATGTGILLLRGEPGQLPAGAVLLKQNETGRLSEIPLQATGRSPTSFPGVEALSFSFPTARLAPGIYTLRIRMERQGGDPLTSPSSVLIVTPEGLRGPWPALDLDTFRPSFSTGVATSEEMPLEGPRLDARTAGELLEEGLASALASFSLGEIEASVRSLRTAQEAVVTGLDGDGYGFLAEAEWELLESRGEHSWERLLPVLYLYSGLVVDYRQLRKPGLSSHCSRLAIRLARTYVAKNGSEQAKHDAADILTSLGGSLLEAGVLSSALEAFEVATELGAPGSAPLLGVAAVREKMGRFREAAETLEVLLRHDPEHAEARLRLAVNLIRTSREERAAVLLEELARLAEPDWIARLAHQEGARLALARGDPEAAAELLTSALERWPGSGAPTILKAWMLDLSGRRAEADALLEGLDRNGSGESETERFRYNLWPEEIIRFDRRQLLPRLRGLLATRAFSGAPAEPVSQR